ncbi:high choriolytic enzyme 1-like [Oncorhynchus mykiss]|uniref:high choriolytic enzyme 1-like n=1 Tax=Oncorhynchus mykiss TaxID=8022 RepID=UPI001878C56D|nr:high choriolytic enzyme 1-like [Oncorhynchus mykiss]
MEQSPSLTILLLVLGLSQAQMDHSGPAMWIDHLEAVDITERILTANNGSDEMLMEGDLVVPRTRNAMQCMQGGNSCLWNKASGGYVEVPYTIEDSRFTPSDRKEIEHAVQSFHSKTCIHFVPRGNQKDYISFESLNGCYSSLGRIGGKQTVSVNSVGCIFLGIIQHETLHALGFQHEQTRSDRDQYIRINWSNIDSNMAYNFDKQNTNNLNTPYDYSSVMHYGKTAFSINGMDTITPIPNPDVSIGQRQGLSTTDILRINRLYGC